NQVIGTFLEPGQGHPTVGRGIHGMTVAAQQPGEPSDHAGFIIHHEDRLPTHGLVYFLLWRRRGHGHLPNRQLDPEDGALSRLTRDPDGAAMPLNNTLAQRQPQASAHSGRFGGKEGLKDARPEPWWDPRPGIHDLQCNPGARRITARSERHLPWRLHLT